MDFALTDDPLAICAAVEKLCFIAEKVLGLHKSY